jgi:hypothetical protein
MRPEGLTFVLPAVEGAWTWRGEALTLMLWLRYVFIPHGVLCALLRNVDVGARQLFDALNKLQNTVVGVVQVHRLFLHNKCLYLLANNLTAEEWLRRSCFRA